MQPRHLPRAALGSAALAVLVALFTLTAQSSAAQPARTGETVTLTFTVIVRAGTPPDDLLFWFCPDAKNDGTGCEEMNPQPDGKTFTYQFTTTTGTTYQHITILWSRGRLPTSNGEIPAPPAHITCDYHPFTVSAANPRSFTCNADFTPNATTPVASVTTAPTPAATASPGNAASGDTSTLVTGLQVIIGVGLVLFVILLAILIWQRTSARKKRQHTR